jgi:hypothetical protein
MEITLHDHSRIHFKWIRPGVLSIELWKPGFLKDGHGLLLKGACYLDGAALEQLLRTLQTPPDLTPPYRPAA